MPATVPPAAAAPSSNGLPRTPARVPRRVVVGVLAGLAVFVSAAVLATITLPWKGTGDSYFHLDYAYQVWHGSIPDPRGPVLDSPVHPDYSDQARQYASAHPPLLYVLAAPMVGPLWDAGHWPYAIMAMRLLVLGFGVATYLLLARTGWTLGGRHREVAAVALPLLATTTSVFVRFSAEVYNDVPVTFFSVAAIALALHALRDGVSSRRALLMGLVVAGGLATKSTFLLTAAVAGTFFLVAAAWHREPGTSRLRAVVRAAWPSAVLPLVLIGWFYVHNALLSGNPVRSTPKLPIDGRSPRTLMDNLSDPAFWLIYPKGFFGSIPWRDLTTLNRQASLVLVTLAATAVAVWLVRHRPWARFATGPLALAPTMLILHLAAFQVAQLYHAVGYGAYNWRYFLPTTLQAGLLLLGGCLALGRRASGPAVVVVAVVLWVASAVNSFWYVGRNFADVLGGATGPAALPAAAVANNIPAVLPTLCAVAAAIAMCVVAVTLARARLVAPDAADAAGPPAAGSGATPAAASA